MVFITCGLGGGTGSGGSSLVAQIAKEMGALTIAVVTKPFSWEGPQRVAIAERAWEELARNVDSIITIPNDRILQLVEKKTGLLEAFKIADDVLRQGVQGISELILFLGLSMLISPMLKRLCEIPVLHLWVLVQALEKIVPLRQRALQYQARF